MDILFTLVYLAFVILAVAGMWKTFDKAGQPGWAAIIPIYNVYIMCLVAQKPGWWVILFLIPIVNIIMAFIVAIGIAEAFGKSAAFGIGLALLGFIFYPLLGFGDARYQGSRAAAPQAQPVE